MPIRRDLNRKTASGKRIFGTAFAGVPGRAVPATGSNGRPGYLYPSLSLPADADVLVRGEILSKPAGLTSFAADEDSSFTATGPNGSYSFAFQIYADDVAVGTPKTASFTITGGSGGSGGTTVALGAAAKAQAGASAQLQRAARLAASALARATASAQLSGGSALASAPSEFWEYEIVSESLEYEIEADLEYEVQL